MKFQAGDVLYGKLRPYLNKVAHRSFDGIASTGLSVVTESDDLDLSYLSRASARRSEVVVNTANNLPRSKQDQRAIVKQIGLHGHLRAAPMHASSRPGPLSSASTNPSSLLWSPHRRLAGWQSRRLRGEHRRDRAI
jgi:hypothetical protein